MEMELISLTKLEAEAVQQLIHLSGGSPVDFHGLWLEHQAEEEEENHREPEEEAESNSAVETEASSSFVLDSDQKCFCEEALPRRISKFGSVLEIYRKTRPFKSPRDRCKRSKNWK